MGGGWLEDGRLAEGDLFVKGEVFGFVERLRLVERAGGGEGFGDDGVSDVFVEPDGEGWRRGLGGNLHDGEGRRSFERRDRRRDGCQNEDRGRCRGFSAKLVEFEEELVLGLGNGASV